MAVPADKKRQAEDELGKDDDKLTFQPLGAGQEVGRSCHILKFKGKTIMLDCGIHPGLHGMMSLPYTDAVDTSEIDLILITHFHLDHCGALPWFVEKTTFKGRIFMTHATKSIFRWLLQDFVKVNTSHMSAPDQQLYDSDDILNTLNKIETIQFHETKDIGGVKFTPYHAGHVLGAAMFMMEISGVKIMYTGDYSREENRHLVPAEIPPVKPDILITESTFGVHRHEDREIRENRFTTAVHSIVDRGGRCLIPTFALGNTQELLLILEEYWAQDPELHRIPIYYASSLAQRCMKLYESSINTMNQKIRDAMKLSNPFRFKHISNLRGNQFDDSVPSVVLATPGMMQSGLSRELFESWCQDPKNGVIMAGYSIEGTLAKKVMDQPDMIETLNNQSIPMRMTVSTISFAAHVDYVQNRDFVHMLAPPHVILVHGELNEMTRFKTAFEQECHENNPDYKFKMYAPENTHILDFYFRGEKMAKVIGDAAKEIPKKGNVVSGLLIKQSFNYHIVAPSELTEHTDLKTSTVTQRQVIAFPYTFAFLRHFMLLMHGEAVSFNTEKIEDERKEVIFIMEKVKIIHDGVNNSVTLEWKATAENDMWADSVLATILQIDNSPEVIRISQSACQHDHKHGHDHKHDVDEEEGKDEDEDKKPNISDPEEGLLSSVERLSGTTFANQLCKHLTRLFGMCTMNDDGTVLVVNVDSISAEVTLRMTTFTVHSTDNLLKESVKKAARRFWFTTKSTADLPQPKQQR